MHFSFIFFFFRQNIIGVELKKTSSDMSDSDDDFEDSMTDSPSPIDEPKDLSKSHIPKLSPTLLPKMATPFDMFAAAANPLMMLNLNPALYMQFHNFFNTMRNPQIDEEENSETTVEVEADIEPPKKRSKLSIDEILNIKSEVSPSQCSPCSNESLSPKRAVKTEEVKKEDDEAAEEDSRSVKSETSEDPKHSSPKSTTSQSE